MGGKSSPPPPDYSGMEALGREQLAFSRQQYAELKPLAERVAASQIAAQEQQMAQAQDYYDYQQQTFRPLEQGLVRDAERFNTEGYREQLAQKAAADVQQAFQGAQGVSMREATRRGINPNSGAFGAASNANSLRLAAATAGAQTGARSQAEQTGYARRLDAVGIGRGLAGASTAAYQAATGAGSAGINTSMAAGNQFQQGLSSAGTTMGNIATGQAGMFNAGQDRQGEMFGAVLGAGATIF